ncbi:hypothetical protein BJ878DRAFT_72425 [Calycina marina]|uniref:Rhodanese domain-containing protein n=1 Tax=Calycina marina TaxID=1763456 RepID=A0A9P8CF32_9HELO|nr:hypothetical protein BJ878DRAFT_72425 [Calycina marina]
MSTYTVATIPRLSSASLSETLLAHASTNSANKPSNLAIVDVRDSDHIGGHIKHSTHVPSQTLGTRIPELVRKLQDKKIVVFHCALSQQRGPSAALRYLRERERLLGAGKETVGGVLKKNSADKGRDGEDVEGEWEDVEVEKEQKVYVLERGFVGWQEEYAEDERLTEGYRKEIWEDGYWM